MKIALVLHRRGLTGSGPEFRLTAHVLDEWVGEGNLLDRIRAQKKPEVGVLPDELSIYRVVDMPTIPGMSEELTRILAGPSSVYRTMYEKWLTEIASLSFFKGDAIGHNEAVMER